MSNDSYNSYTTQHEHQQHSSQTPPSQIERETHRRRSLGDMGSNGVDGALSQVSRPGGLTLSRCRTNKHRKTKLRTDNKKLAANRASGRSVSTRKRSSSHRPSILSKTLPVPSFQSHDKKLEELEKSFFDNDTPPLSSVEKTKATKPVEATVVVARPPIPTFQWSDDDQEGDRDLFLREPALVATKQSTNQDKAAPTAAPVAGAISQNSTTAAIIANDAGANKFYGESEADTGGTAKENNNSNNNNNNNNQSLLPLTSVKTADSNSKLKDMPNTSVALPNVAPRPNNISTMAAPEKKSRKRQRPQPSHDELTRAVDQAFEASDIHAMTVKQFILDIEQLFQVKFTVKTKAFVKKRLYYHMNERVPSGSQQSPPRLNDNGNTANSIETNKDPPGTLSVPESNGQTCLSNGIPLASRSPADPALVGPAQPTTGSQQSREGSQSTDSRSIVASSMTNCQPQRSLNDAPTGKPKVDQALVSKLASESTRTIDITGLDSDSDESFQPVEINRKRPLRKAAPELNDESFDFMGDTMEEPQCKVQRTAPNQAELKPKEQKPVAAAKSKVADHDGTGPSVAKPTKGGKKPPAKKKAAAAKPSRKRKPACKLCKTCPCKTEQKGSSSPAEFDLSKLKRSERAIERKLESRLDELQREAERYEGEADRVRRELKKRERIRLRREQAEKVKSTGDTLQSGTYQFLPDGRELDYQLEHIESTKVPGEEIKKAQIKMFGKDKQPGKFCAVIIYLLSACSSGLV